MSVQAEYFKVDIGTKDQVDINSMNKDKNQLIKKYLENLKNNCKELIGSIPEKNENNNFIEIISVDNDSIFGIIGKSTKVEEGLMQKIRDQKGENIKSTDFNLEDYRFFVFHTPSLRCAVIKHSPAPAFQQLFTSFLRKYEMPGISTINTIPIKDEKINKKLMFFKKISKINMIFARGSSKQSQMISPDGIFGISENSLVKSSASLEFRDQAVTKRLKDLIKDRDLIEYEFEKLEFIGENQFDQQETLEFVKKLLTLNIDIDLSEDTLQFSEEYFEQIKKALIKSFNEF